MFKQQFYGSLASTHQKTEVVEIKDCSYEVFNLMLELLYDDAEDKKEKELLISVDAGLLFELLRLADKYQIQGNHHDRAISGFVVLKINLFRFS